MNNDHDNSPYPSDICLLLRAHGEQRWLLSEVLPVLRELERPQLIPEDQLGAALAYLEVLWIDAARRAAETEAAFDQLLATDAAGDRLLHGEARQYHAAVRALRDSASRQATRLIALPGRRRRSHEHAGC